MMIAGRSDWSRRRKAHREEVEKLLRFGLMTRQQIVDTVGDGCTLRYVTHVSEKIGVYAKRQPPTPPPPERKEDAIKARAAKLLEAMWERQKKFEVGQCNFPIIFR